MEKILTSGGVIMIRWDLMSVDGIGRAEQAVTALKQQFGKVTYYAVVPGSAPIPDEPTRKCMTQSLKLFQSICDSINLVFEGRGLKTATARSVAASIFLISGNRKMATFSSLEDAFLKHCPGDAVRLCVLAREQGITVPLPQ